jgi:lipopolysaccharide export system protein LptC
MTLPRPIYLVLIFISCWCVYYLYGKTDPEILQVKPNVELPAFSGKDLLNTSYAENGVRNFDIRSNFLDHFAKSGDTVFETLELSVYREGDVREWAITANKGVLNDDNVLTLTGNVLAKNLNPEAGFDSMTTEKLIIELVSKDFNTDEPVKLVGPTFISNGNAMVGNFGDNTATLFNQVQSIYETKTP